MTARPGLGRQGLVLAVLGCLVGGAVLLVAAGRVWGSTVVRTQTGARSHLTVTGSSVEPALPGIGVALLALAVALLAARAWLRRVVGVVVVLTAAAALALAVAARGDVGRALTAKAFDVQLDTLHVPASAWWVVAAAGALLGVAAGAATVAFARRWPGLGARYDAPAARRPGADSAAATWDALDRGEDPTA